MNALAIILSVFGTLCALFVAEVAAIMFRKPAFRPSSHLKAVGAWLYRVAEGLGTLVGFFTDLLGGLKCLVFWIRDTFFKFIPKEVIEEAWRDLRAALKEITHAPLGFFWGLYDSICAAALPWLSAGVLFVAVVVSPVAMEVALRLAGVESWLPSALLWGLGTRLYAGFFGVGGLLEAFKDLKRLAIVVVSRLFGWVPLDLITNSTNAVWAGAGGVLASPRGLYDGLRTWADEQTTGAVLIGCAIGAVGGLAIWLLRLGDRWVREAEARRAVQQHQQQLQRQQGARPRSVSVSAR
jgi:hypothetical protein